MVPFHGPEKCLEHRDDTFWMAESKELAEIRIEFTKVEHVQSVWIMTSTYNTSPQYVTISAVLRKDARTYVELVDRAELPLLKEHRWHSFPLPLTASKYFKLSFQHNHGSDSHIAVRQIRFVKAREKSAQITLQPASHVLTAGPAVGDTAHITLLCEAEGWPLPSFQWYVNKRKIPGAVKPELRLTLKCPSSAAMRSFRCTRCRMTSKSIPINAYHIKCGNCGYRVDFKDVEEYDLKIVAIQKQEVEVEKEKKNLETTKAQLEVFGSEPKYAAMIEDLEAKLSKLFATLQSLKESRIHLKETLATVNRFSDEGIYTCHVANIRGGGVRIKRKSQTAVVVVEHSIPYLVSVRPHYEPRPQIFRKKWTIYSSLLGTFRHGRVEGIVTIRFNDGSFYEGPYVEEAALDQMGLVSLTGARASDHYGIFRANDGRVFEGANVDNHFNLFNLQSHYRLTLPNKEVYEGQFCDEMFHGVGMYSYSDGSVYEGRWHRGTRFGHGLLRSSEGWAYEGFFDTNRRHRHGVINWPDGSCYLGDWYYDKMQGKGIYITALRDVYRGEVRDGYFHGHGEIVYADTSHYVGEFKHGFRDGKGIFTEREGDCYFGHFKADKKHGEHVCKVMIPIEEAGQDNYEIRVGLFDKGNFVQWKSKFANPLATKQFINLFRQNRDMFDSVYSMVIAKNLPNLPDGIDPFNDHVKNIILRIRNEAGMLVGEQALRNAQNQVDALLGPLRGKDQELEQLKKDIEVVSLKVIHLQQEANHIKRHSEELLSQFDRAALKIEQHWADEPLQVRAKFQQACKALTKLTVEEFFAFRNHRVVPVFTKKIFDAISYLLKLPLDWKSQQFVVADSVTNSRNGDDEASRFDYTCKLCFMMKSYEVYTYCDLPHLQDIEAIVSDARFRRDSYYIQSTGVAGPPLVDWVKTNLAYLKVAQRIVGMLRAADDKKLESLRLRTVLSARQKELEEAAHKQQELKQHLKAARTERAELDRALLRANDLLQFVVGRFSSGESESKMDYYKLLEARIEQRKDRFTVEICLQGLVKGVEGRLQEEARRRRRDALARGQGGAVVGGEDGDVGRKPPGLLRDWIRDEVLAQQADILASGRSLGYGFEDDEDKKALYASPKEQQRDRDGSSAVSGAFTAQVVSLVVDLLVGRLNDALNDRAASQRWLGPRGRVFTSRFLYVLTWQLWREEAVRVRDAEARAAWERIFGDDPEHCARMAIESRTNARMSSLARSQAKVWARSHPIELQLAETALAVEFAEAYSEQPGANALWMLAEEAAPGVTPTMRAQAACWLKLNPEEAALARDERHRGFAAEFEAAFSKSPAETCFKILSGWASPQELLWAQHADHWRSFNMDTYSSAASQLQSGLAKEFEDARPANTAADAARIIELRALCELIPYPDCADEFMRAQLPSVASMSANAKERLWLGAHCWRVGHQGRVRQATQQLRTEMAASFSSQWAELLSQTEDFRKGSLQAALLDLQEVDRFVGLRLRLSRRFGWLVGYLAREQGELLGQLQALTLTDPADRVLHRVRPSQEAKEQKKREEAFLLSRGKLEAQLAQSLARTAQWQSYFGAPPPPVEPAKNTNTTNNSSGKNTNSAAKTAAKDSKEKGNKEGKGEAAVRQMKQLASKGKDKAKSGKDRKPKK